MAAAAFLRSLSLLLAIAVLGCCAQEEQVSILLEFKKNLDDPTDALHNWGNSTSPCQWIGINCNNASLVTGISLEGRGLRGPVASALCGLKSLKIIELGANFLRGTITDVLWKNCSQLEVLNLTTNSLVGYLPDFSSLSSLQVLDLSRNGFSGKFPLSVTKLSNLYALNLNDNPLDASLLPKEIYSMIRLKALRLSNISLKGTISPSIGNLTKLGNIELSYNNLEGTIPKEITKLTKLYQLELYNNLLTGELPSGFGNLTALINFDASVNSLTGNLSELAGLKNIASLHLYENLFSGSIPEEFGEFLYLRDLSLYGNNLTGALPWKLGSLSPFSAMDISENRLSGPLPPDMCKNGRLTFFLALENDFTGEIPKSYENCSSLVRFRLSDNRLGGRIPSGIWGLPHATIIDLGDNNFEGEIGPEIKNAKNLSILSIQNNRFSGSIPPEIGQAVLLAKVDATNNQLSGRLPNEIGQLGVLNSLHLAQNMLSGPIPGDMGLCEDLSELNLAMNRLSGPIPESLGSIQVLNSLNLSSNQLRGQIPSTLSTLKLSLLDFSNNQLTGAVPAQLLHLASNTSFYGNPGLCVNEPNSKVLRACPSQSRNRSSARNLAAGLISGAAVVILVVGWTLYKNMYRPPESPSWYLQSFHKLSFTEDDILRCLKHDNVIGSGGSGKVFRGELNNGEIIAVKQILANKALKPNNAQETVRNRQFEMEVETLSSVRHRNIVKLYCCLYNGDASLLVYEYMKNGSLWSRLHEATAPVLDWQTRYNIALGTARGLFHLHHDCVPPILHRDVKSSNILLDEDYVPRLADFGVAKVLQSSARGDSTQAMVGTHGYIAPEYAYTYRVSDKSDVYSFGVVLMELVTGKRPIEPEFGENKEIIHWTSSRISTRENAYAVLDRRISRYCEEGMVMVLKIALLCTRNLPAMRPCMREVVEMLLQADPCLGSPFADSAKIGVSRSGSCKL